MGFSMFGDLKESTDAATAYTNNCLELNKLGIQFRKQSMVRWSVMTNKEDYL
jgi:hypothetical protein